MLMRVLFAGFLMVLASCSIDQSHLEKEDAVEIVTTTYKAIDKANWSKAEKLMTPDNQELMGLVKFHDMVGDGGDSANLSSGVDKIDWDKYEFTKTEGLAKLFPGEELMSQSPGFGPQMPKAFFFKKVGEEWFLHGTNMVEGI